MNLKYFIVFVAGMAALAGCQEASEYIPSIYITEAQRQEVKTITISQAGEKAEFTVSAAQIVDRDTHVSFEACPELVADYNDRYGRTAVALEDFTFAKKEVVIAAGKNVSESVEVVVNEELKPGTFYCLPVKIASTDGGMSILESSSKLFLVFRAPVRSKAVYIGSGNKCFVPTFPEHPSFEGLNLETMQEVTLECRVMVNSFTKSDPYISSIMGFEGDVCMRFGDVKIGYDVLQVCKGDYQPAAINSPCAPNLWQRPTNPSTRRSGITWPPCGRALHYVFILTESLLLSRRTRAKLSTLLDTINWAVLELASVWVQLRFITITVRLTVIWPRHVSGRGRSRRMKSPTTRIWWLSIRSRPACWPIGR